MQTTSRTAIGARERLLAARLYCVTPEWPADPLLKLSRAALQGGADMLQLRHKSMRRGELLQIAKRLRTLCHRMGRLFIVNDFVDIALLSGADGVHLGPNDLSLTGARRVAGTKLLLGASASTPSEAQEAARGGADYIGAGPAFATPLKAEKRVIGVEGVAAVAAAAEIPVFAIGGIDATNVRELTLAGVNRICVIRALAEAADPEAEARRLKALL